MRKWLIALMVVLSVVLGTVVAGLRFATDRKGPEITFSSKKEAVYKENMTEEELLKGVAAIDNRDGDVSDSLKVECIFNEETNQVYVSYVAKDSSNNVTKKQFIMETNGQKKSGKDSDEEVVKEEAKENETEDGADDSVEEDQDGKDPEEEQTEEELSKEEEAKKREEQKIESLAAEAPKFHLTTYYIEIPVGTSVDQLSYVADIQDDTDETNRLYRQIQIEGNVDIHTPGTYELTYYVVDSNGNESNRAVLTVEVQ